MCPDIRGPVPIMHGVGIFLLDDEAKPNAALGINLYGAPVLELRGQHGTAALAAGTPTLTRYGGPALMIKNTIGQAHLGVEGGQGPDSGARLNLTSLSSPNKETEIDLKTT